MNGERLASPTPVLVDACSPLVWVEAEQVFVARGYIYRARGRCGHIRDSETVIARTSDGEFAVMSSYAPSQLAAMPPRGWTQIEPLCELREGERLGAVIVAVKHGTNEYTVVNTEVNATYLAPGSR